MPFVFETQKAFTVVNFHSVVSLSGVALLRYIYAVKSLHTNSTLEYKLPRPCCLLTCIIISRALVFHVITRGHHYITLFLFFFFFNVN